LFYFFLKKKQEKKINRDMAREGRDLKKKFFLMESGVGFDDEGGTSTP
jgi:hypothetical protein